VLHSDFTSGLCVFVLSIKGKLEKINKEQNISLQESAHKQLQPFTIYFNHHRFWPGVAADWEFVVLKFELCSLHLNRQKRNYTYTHTYKYTETAVIIAWL